MPSEKQIEAAMDATNGNIPVTLLVRALTAAEQAEPAPAATGDTAKKLVKAMWGVDLVEPAPSARSGTVKVKALEWVRGWMNAEAQTDIGLYQIAYRRDGSFEWCFGIKKEWASSWDAAKAAAQADYERRILAALEHAEPATDAEPGTDTLYGTPPQDVIDAARKVEHYFASKGISEWELCGVASRHHTRPPESRYREALEEIANLKPERDRSDDYNRGFADGRWQAVKISRAALAQEDGR